MQFWFARDSKVSIREQLVTQVVLGILSDDLRPGQRLPSTRELARRFHVHPNTVSAGYRQLARDGWVEFRRGSGVYVRSKKAELSHTSNLALDQLIAGLVRSARRSQISLPELRAGLRQWLALQPPDHFLLIEPDEELRRILAAEIRQTVALPAEACCFEECANSLDGAIPVALGNREAKVRQLLTKGMDLILLQIRSVPSSLADWLPAPPGKLVGVVSRWPDFLKIARAILGAAGFHPDSLVFRDAREPDWRRGLKQTAAVVCDSLIVKDLPPGCKAISFRLLSEGSIAELRRQETFIGNPID
ncbi:MAG TPA: GntR family transcriptional regulator [Candidatus Sulfotelmatobacter sp.]|nr:GntR family transcriptional regulator [Candidatus Sulfotelmatobacter sp.]